MEFLDTVLEHVAEHGWELIADKAGGYFAEHPTIAAIAGVICVLIAAGWLIFRWKNRTAR